MNIAAPEGDRREQEERTKTPEITNGSPLRTPQKYLVEILLGLESQESANVDCPRIIALEWEFRQENT